MQNCVSKIKQFLLAKDYVKINVFQTGVPGWTVGVRANNFSKDTP